MNLIKFEEGIGLSEGSDGDGPSLESLDDEINGIQVLERETDTINIKTQAPAINILK